MRTFAKGKTVVFSILESNGELFTKVVPNASCKSLIPPIHENVPRGTRTVPSHRDLTYLHLKVRRVEPALVGHRCAQG